MNNNVNLLVEPPAYDSENNEDDNDSLILENENNDAELPPYEDNNNESQFFLNNKSINIVLNKKLFKFILQFTFLIIYIAFFFLITKPLVIDTCKDPIITNNSTCHHDYMCDSNNKCDYIDSCNIFTCQSLMGWFYYLIVLTCIPSLIILQCLIYLFNFITKNKYLRYII